MKGALWLGQRHHARPHAGISAQHSPRAPLARGPAPAPPCLGAKASRFITAPSILDKNRLPCSAPLLSHCYVNAAPPTGKSLVLASAARCQHCARAATLNGQHRGAAGGRLCPGRGWMLPRWAQRIVPCPRLAVAFLPARETSQTWFRTASRRISVSITSWLLPCLLFPDIRIILPGKWRKLVVVGLQARLCSRDGGDGFCVSNQADMLGVCTTMVWLGLYLSQP